MNASTGTSPRMEPGRSIVVVNDEAVYLQIIEATIGACCTHPLLVFQNAGAAWEAVSQSDPALLITDDKMPDLTGEEICQRLLAGGATFPIIVTSGWPLTEQWVQECARAGLNVVMLQIPFAVERLGQVLSERLAQRRA